MAYADYRHCDVCDAKAFYDANLNYDFSPDGGTEKIEGYPYALDYLGAWTVLCTDCVKTHKLVIVEREKEAGRVGRPVTEIEKIVEEVAP